MKRWTRRGTIAALSGALVAPAILRPEALRAQTVTAPVEAGQAPGYYRTRAGDHIVTTLFDGELRRPVGEGYVRNAPLDEVRDAMRLVRLPPDHFFNPYIFTAVETEGGAEDGIVLIDTGTGDLFDPLIDEGARSMEVARIVPEAVSLVVLTHFHPDHVGGLTRADGAPAFPNARVLFPELERDFLLDDAAHDRPPPA